MELSGVDDIRNHTQLRLHIMHLKARREELEDLMRHEVKEMYYSVHPLVLLRNAMLGDRENGQGIKRTGLKLVGGFLINRLFNKGGSLRGFVSAALIERAFAGLVDKYTTRA